MDIEKCEKCPKKNGCEMYNSYIDSIKDDYEIESVIIPYLDTEHSLFDSDYIKSLYEKYPPKPLIDIPQPTSKTPLPGDSKSKEYTPLDVIGDFVHSLFEKNSSSKINVFDLPMLSLKENPNHMPLRGRKFRPSDRIVRAVQFWKEILIEETDKELVELSIESLQYLLPDNDIIENIRENDFETLNGVYEKCRKMKIKGFIGKKSNKGKRNVRN